jgi:hypothetical protein
VVASQLGLQHTLLASSVKQQQARFIQDCSLYMQVRAAAAAAAACGCGCFLPAQ